MPIFDSYSLYALDVLDDVSMAASAVSQNSS